MELSLGHLHADWLQHLAHALVMHYVSVGLLGGREQGNLRKCFPSALESALRNRGAPESAPDSALEGALPVAIHSTERALSGALSGAPRYLRALTFGDFPVLGPLAGQQTRNA